MTDQHNNSQFSTKDRDNDLYGEDCAKRHHGGWWYDHCYMTNLNGNYLQGEDDTAVVWVEWRNYYSLKRTEMKMRPVVTSV